jgi:hypothetical protein
MVELSCFDFVWAVYSLGVNLVWVVYPLGTKSHNSWDSREAGKDVPRFLGDIWDVRFFGGKFGVPIGTRWQDLQYVILCTRLIELCSDFNQCKHNKVI